MFHKKTGFYQLARHVFGSKPAEPAVPSPELQSTIEDPEPTPDPVTATVPLPDTISDESPKTNKPR